jgi:hypothetical protein
MMRATPKVHAKIVPPPPPAVAPQGSWINRKKLSKFFAWWMQHGHRELETIAFIMSSTRPDIGITDAESLRYAMNSMNSEGNERFWILLRSHRNDSEIQ